MVLAQDLLLSRSTAPKHCTQEGCQWCPPFTSGRKTALCCPLPSQVTGKTQPVPGGGWDVQVWGFLGCASDGGEHRGGLPAVPHPSGQHRGAPGRLCLGSPGREQEAGGGREARQEE